MLTRILSFLEFILVDLWVARDGRGLVWFSCIAMALYSCAPRSTQIESLIYGLLAALLARPEDQSQLIVYTRKQEVIMTHKRNVKSKKSKARPWYSVSSKGLIEAAEFVAKILGILKLIG